MEHRWCTFTEKAFVEILLLITYMFAPTELVVIGDEDGDIPSKTRGENVVLIANHQCYADWIYLWFLAYSQNAHGMMKIILKDGLKHYPIIGWGMQAFDFIFLRRNWSDDQFNLSLALDNLTRNQQQMDDDKNFWLLLFPEGTVVNPNTMEKSRQYWQRQVDTDSSRVLPTHPKHHLLPRSTGLRFILDNFHTRRQDVALYDLTMAYYPSTSDQVVEKLYTLRNIFGDLMPPQRVYFYCRKLQSQQYTSTLRDEQAFSLYLQDRFMEKDELMAEFYNRGSWSHFQSSMPSKTYRVGRHSWLDCDQECGTNFALVKVWMIWCYYLGAYLILSHL
ncbi:hypothetical protein MIR68_008399 [Amoeboaphelidium protococcarum]|nr:hypothetical protein MIR68_008399 [Amoeboaphelidium protococcarum]